MKVLLVYDSSVAKQLCAAAVAASCYRASTNEIELFDTTGLDTAAIGVAIGLLTPAYYNRVITYCYDAGNTNPPAGNLVAGDILLLDALIDTADPVSDAATTSIPASSTGTYRPVLSWNDCYGTGITPAKAVFMMGEKNTYTITGTASGGTANTLVDAGAGWTVNAYADQWVCVLSGTGVGSVLQIISNTADTLTVNGSFSENPSGTSVYQVCNRQELCLASEYLDYAVLTYLHDLSDSAVMAEWYKLIDVDGLSLAYQRKSPLTDNSALANYLLIGKHIFDYSNL